MSTYKNWRIKRTAQSNDLEKEIMAFFRENPNPNDDALHDWAEGKGYDVHEVETEIYRLLTKFSQNQKG